ncbi:FadR/GntR family transcriptional regulator [Peribacillus cavernae]|nr:FadR/GntR family transcriptional regulator [Peribacillus cavernae]MDQ0221121.1 DNA-binding FadR family transcriptional regulator [Peribacillus cavernae]
MSMYRKVQSKSLSGHIADQIEGLIVSGQIKRGEKLPTERELCEKFEVSRTTIREAIKTLQDKGLIQVTQGRGTFATNDILEKNVENMGLIIKLYNVENSHLMEARSTLEVTIAGIAAERRTDTDIASLHNCLDEMEKNIDDVELFLENDANFHIHLAEATQNILYSIWIKPIATILLAEKELEKDRRKRVIESHRDLFHAVIQKDKTRAEEAMLLILNQYENEIQ